MNLRKDHCNAIVHTHPRTVIEGVGAYESLLRPLFKPNTRQTKRLKQEVNQGDAIRPISNRAVVSPFLPSDIQTKTTLNNGYLGSRNDEERSEMRYVV